MISFYSIIFKLTFKLKNSQIFHMIFDQKILMFLVDSYKCLKLIILFELILTHFNFCSIL
ncbi:hypothetical protein BpHYR1_020304 [Brachionus plicatilis]|uniref:Uncharacterized protein n=1 Tax=Brachionus plicatilis TaxID=10195 RepID=A0A3M7RDD8_BRAPC|nr:hypothetical protein BpHYR1_020304 [Brachionus plicatilis]